jgi:hypothetical protein
MNRKSIVIVAAIVVLINMLMIFGCMSNSKDNTELTIKTADSYIGTAACKKCHSKIDTLIFSGFHKGIDCEKCHGPGSVHLTGPIVHKMKVHSERTDCALCHANDSTKAAGIKQVDISKHNPNSKCIKCHDPHNTGFGRLAGDKKQNANSSACIICHAKVNKMRLGGVHKTVECQACHSSWEKHLDNPKAAKPTKTPTRNFCGKCHGQGLVSASGKIKLIDLKEHNVDANCTECHNAHSPWD